MEKVAINENGPIPFSFYSVNCKQLWKKNPDQEKKKQKDLRISVLNLHNEVNALPSLVALSLESVEIKNFKIVSWSSKTSWLKVM